DANVFFFGFVRAGHEMNSIQKSAQKTPVCHLSKPICARSDSERSRGCNAADGLGEAGLSIRWYNLQATSRDVSTSLDMTGSLMRCLLRKQIIAPASRNSAPNKLAHGRGLG